MASRRVSQFSIASIFFIFFIDNLCWSIVFPIFAPYFLDVHNQIFSPEVSEGMRTTLLGICLAAFSLGQFIGAPILGEYADRNGRKKALLLSLLFTLVGLIITAWSIQAHLLWVLFIGRLITGVFASNTSICLACISDFSDTEKTKLKYFGYLSVLAGAAFIVGAFAGGTLADTSLNDAFSPQFPLWIAGGLTLANIIFFYFGFKETSVIDHSIKFDFFECFRNIKQALRTEKIKQVYAIYFLFLFSWTMLFQFTPVLLVQLFDFTSSNIGEISLFMGICWALGSSYFYRLLSHYLSSSKILDIALIIFTILCGSIIFPKNLYFLFPILGIAILLGGLSWVICMGIISNLAPKNIQGKILGMSQSVQSLAMSIAPLIGGMAAQGAIQIPFLLGAASGAIALFIHFRLHRIENSS
jgi:DHA1 family tetracycline resistance protein-like MFS transporter